MAQQAGFTGVGIEPAHADTGLFDAEWVVQYRVADPNKFLHIARNELQELRDQSNPASGKRQ